MSPTVSYLWEFSDLSPPQGGEVRCGFFCLFSLSCNIVEELELFWQKLAVTDEEEVSVNLGRECTRATKERGKNCLVMKVLSHRGINVGCLKEKYQDVMEAK